MSDRRTLLVAGLGRCGTSLAMRMLDAAGVPTIGTFPDWEPPEVQRMLEDDPTAWADHVSGHAVKLLDAHRWPLPDLGEFYLLWLARDPKEQAKSMFKLMSTMFSSIRADRAGIRAMARSISKDTPLALRAIERAGQRRKGIALTFENIIDRPVPCAQIMCAAFDIDPANVDVMAAQVAHRTSKCLPFMLEANFV